MVWTPCQFSAHGKTDQDAEVTGEVIQYTVVDCRTASSVRALNDGTGTRSDRGMTTCHMT